MNRARAAELAAEITAAIAGAGLTGTAVTDGTAAGPELDSGTPAIVIQAPKITYDTHHQAHAEWDVIAAAGPALDPWAAWETLDGILAVLLPVLDTDRAEPAQFQPQQGPAYPAYVLTFTEHYNL